MSESKQRGRPRVNKTEDEIKEALETNETIAKAAAGLDVSNTWLYNKIKELEIDAKAILMTPPEELDTGPSFNDATIKRLFKELQSGAKERLSGLTAHFKFDKRILLIGSGDWHLGARYVYYDDFVRDMEFIRDTPNVFAVGLGDYCDNYNTTSYKSGQQEQAMKLPNQKAAAEFWVKQLSEKLLCLLNGCHDNWSATSDQFELGQHLAKHTMGVYLRHWGFLDLEVGDNLYQIFVTHNTYRNSGVDSGKMLRKVLEEAFDYDIGMKAHHHKPHAEQWIHKGKMFYQVSCGSYKGQDWHASVRQFPPLYRSMPGIILGAKEREIIIHHDYRQLIKYL